MDHTPTSAGVPGEVLTIPVVMAGGQNYALYLVVCLASLFANAAPETRYRVHVMVSTAYAPDVRERFAQLERQFPGHAISFAVMGDAFADVSIRTSHVDLHTYLRLLIPQQFPELSRCIYLDGDTVVEQDLTEFFTQPMDDAYLTGVMAAAYHARPDARAQRDGMPSYDRYVNAGVLVMNLDKIRADGLPERFLELADADFESDDQDVLNVACYQGIHVVPMRFNLMTKYLPLSERRFAEIPGVARCWDVDELRQALASPVIIHYADKRKPWADLSVDLAGRWWFYAVRSPYRDEAIDRLLPGAIAAASAVVVSYRDLLPGRGAAIDAEAHPRALAKVAELEEAMKLADRKAARDAAAVADLTRQRDQERKRRRDQGKQLRDVRKSVSFRIGRAITALPRRLFRRG